MPCDHKFINELDLERIDFAPATLIVGTFIPEWPMNNTEWFYGPASDPDGKSSNIFWDVLPRIYGEQSLINASPREWKLFCHQKQIAITGLIRLIEDADPDDPRHVKALGSLADNAIVHNFEEFEYTNIVQLLRRHPTIRNVYLTRGVTESFWRHLWNPVMQYCNLNGLHERRLLAPSASPLYQHEAYNNENAQNPIPLLEDYILMRWLQDWHL